MINLLALDFSHPLAFVLIFFSGAIIGDNSFVVLGFLASQSNFNIWLSLVFLFLGVVVADYLFYLVGKSKFFKKAKKVKVIGKVFERVDDTIDFVTANHTTLAFFYCKFITGAKFLIDVYLGKKGVSHKRFISMTLLAAVTWSIFAFLVGYVAGEGLLLVLDIFESLTLGLLFVLIFIALSFKFMKKVKGHVHKRYGLQN